MPSVSPRATLKLTPFNACTTGAGLPRSRPASVCLMREMLRQARHLQDRRFRHRWRIGRIHSATIARGAPPRPDGSRRQRGQRRQAVSSGRASIQIVGGEGAARVKGAALRSSVKRRRRSFDRAKRLSFAAALWHRAQQAKRVSVARLREHVGDAAVSTIRPAYMTAMRSQVCATTPRSCVTRITLMPSRSLRSRMSFRIWSWMVTSSAVVGSSASSSFGSLASAIAIMTRWRMPPENWCG